MPRTGKLYLDDILASAKKIQRYVGDSEFDDLIHDELKVDAIVRNFEIIGEASSKIQQDIKGKYPIVEWRKIADFRNILAHEYFGINYKIMWDIIKNKLPELKEIIEQIINEEYP